MYWFSDICHIDDMEVYAKLLLFRNSLQMTHIPMRTAR